MNFVISMELVLYIIMCYRGRSVKHYVSRVKTFSSQISSPFVCAGEVFPGTLALARLGCSGLLRPSRSGPIVGAHKGARAGASRLGLGLDSGT
ncbi:Cytidylate kinase [Frankliniella fusca]|uniref:Cytidylate kinase n=1 Tax=Frankliniella fusca TaxID=407009 RepID=A0AAE1LGG0_9NEOP|nr:Cytidylate kinase [Frankliniella fusca]